MTNMKIEIFVLIIIFTFGCNSKEQVRHFLKANITGETGFGASIYLSVDFVNKKEVY